MPAPKLRFIDALRGFAIFLVLIVHTAQPYSHVRRPERARSRHAVNPTNIEQAPVEQPEKVDKADEPGANFVGYTRSGEHGVQLFFLVSALTLFHSLDRRKVDERRPILNFFIRRVARIGPLFWAAMIFFLSLTWIFNAAGNPNDPHIHGPLISFVRFCLHYGIDANAGETWLGNGGHVTWAGIFATAFFVNDWNPYWVQAIVWGGWSVAVETMFYMFVPLLFRLIRSIEGAAVFLLLAIVIAVTFDLQVRHHPLIPEKTSLWHDATEYMLPYQLPVFAAGILCFFLLKRGPLAARKTVRNSQAGSEVLARAGSTGEESGSSEYLRTGLIGDDASEDRSDRTPVSFATRHRNQIRAWVLLGIFAYLFWALPSVDGPLLPPTVSYSIAFVFLTLSLGLHEIPLIVNGFFRYLGKISYSVYLTHLVVLQPLVVLITGFVEEHHYHVHPPQYWLITLFLTTAVSMAVSTVTYWLIEQPGQLLGRRLIDRLERHHVPVRPLAEAAASL